MMVESTEGEGPKMERTRRRRTSSRLQTYTFTRDEKELLLKKRVELLDREDGSSSAVGPRKRRRVNNPEPEKSEGGDDNNVGGDQVRNEKDEGLVVGGGGCDKSVHSKLKETLRLFNKHYLHFVQEEELRCSKAELDKKKPSTKNPKSAKESKSTKKGKAIKGNAKKNKMFNEDKKGKAKRPDLKAISKMIESNEIMYPDKRFGDIPGIKVGHRFYSRCEMVAIGFHSHWLCGIDTMGKSYCRGEYSNYTFPLAVAIVLSGMYEDDLDNADNVIYTGQGGHNLTGNKRQIRDQKMERGNLALKNNVDQCVPVRVIRGHDSESSYTGRVYTYDGLYKVERYWAEKGISGFTVFKFRLRRIEGQPVLTTNQVHFSHGRVPKSLSEIRGLVCEDISGGLEKVPIPATNLVDDPPVAPTGYKYIQSIQVAKNVDIPVNVTRCNCKGTCFNPLSCACAKLNGSEFPYVYIPRDGGRLIEPKDVVFECGPKCGCGPDCVNRTSQLGLKCRLEVFRTPKKGWAVRSWDFIPAGAPVCEYIGILMKTEDIDQISENSYIFEIDCLQTMKGLGGRERRLKDVLIPSINGIDGTGEYRSESIPEFCIDAGYQGNVARFINHSCEPNLFVQCILSSHQDVRLARVVLVAADNIPPLEELTYDYGYALNSVHGPDGKIVQMPCYCGALQCRRRLF